MKFAISAFSHSPSLVMRSFGRNEICMLLGDISLTYVPLYGDCGHASKNTMIPGWHPGWPGTKLIVALDCSSRNGWLGCGTGTGRRISMPPILKFVSNWSGSTRLYAISRPANFATAAARCDIRVRLSVCALAYSSRAQNGRVNGQGARKCTVDRN